MRIIILILFVCIITIKLYGQKIETVYLDSKDTTTNLYVIIYPEQLPYKGFLFLIDGFGGTSQDVLVSTDLPTYAAKKGFLTIIPTFKTGPTSFGIDDATQQSFRDILQHVTSRHQLKSLPFYVGGFSIGGSCAVKFAELANKDNYEYKPTGVFAIDAPLDFERLYYSYKRSMRLSIQTPPTQETVYMIQRIEQELGGTPQNAIGNYYKYSPYSFSDTSQTAIKYLLNTAVKLFTEPDVQWWLKERGSDYSGMNALDASCMINELNLLGNKNAFLVTTQNKGYRKPDNRRHPHSWSIAEPTELIQWMLAQK